MNPSTIVYRWLWPDRIKKMNHVERQALVDGLGAFATLMLEKHPRLFAPAMHAWKNPAWVDFILRNGLSPFVVALDGEKVVGVSKYNIEKIHQKWVGEIGLEMVDPSYQRRGIASGMVHRIINFSRRSNIQTIHVNATTPENKLRYLKWSQRGGKPYYVRGEKRMIIDSIFFGKVSPHYNVRISVTPMAMTRNLHLLPRKVRKRT